MKRKWKILFALLAAAAIVLAAGCSDDSGDAWTDEAASQESANSGASSSPIEIAKDDVEKLLQSIENVKGNKSSDLCYWDFASGKLDLGDEGCTFTVSWVDKNKTSSYTPTIATTLDGIKNVGKASTSLLAIDLSSAEWTDKPESTGSSKTTTGTVAATIELADGASASHTIPSSLQSVTIVMKADDWLISSKS